MCCPGALDGDLELRQRRDQLVDGVGGFLELGFFVGGEV
jgi:hypothetical protein